jgi:HK97 family phage prohead protease
MDIEKVLAAKKSAHYSVKGNTQLSLKDVDTVGRTVTGFYNTFNYFDSDFDVLVPGSAKKTIKERGPESTAVAKIKHALFHDLNQLPGKIKVLAEREVNGLSGIYFETRMSDTTIGNDTLKNYLDGVYDNHSIGFRYINIEMIEKASTKAWDKAVQSLVNPEEAEKAGIMFLVKEIELYEGSTVAFGANKLTPALGVKSGNKDALTIAIYNRINGLEKILKNGTQSDETMQSFQLQCLQLKQIVAEITEQITPLKPHSSGAGAEKTDQVEEPASQINYKQLIENFKLT